MLAKRVKRKANRLRWQYIGKIRKLFVSPFEDAAQHLIVHGCHHRAGTTWFRNILSSLADYYGLHFVLNDQSMLTGSQAIFFQNHSCIDFSLLPGCYKGSHVIRDPRDMVISAYHYHLWTKEGWANKPIREIRPDIEAYWSLLPVNKIRDMTYKLYLRSLSREEGICAEIQRASTTCIRDMVSWDYTKKNILELKYEEVMSAQQNAFAKLFQHYGFSKHAIDNSLKIAERFTFSNTTGRTVGQVRERSHVRSGKSGQWEHEFNDFHKDYFKELHGEDLIKLGYEHDIYW